MHCQRTIQDICSFKPRVVSMQRISYIILTALIINISSTFAMASELDSILQSMANSSKQNSTLQAKFVQKKQLSFLKQALQSQGHFFFTKDYQGHPAILWEYLSPAPSGILFQKNVGWIWLQERSTIKKAQRYEGSIVNTMVKKILNWFTFDQKTIKNDYDISIDKHVENKIITCLKLKPKDETFFASLQLCINNENYTIKSMTFNESNGDSTELDFEDIQINKPYPSAFPDGTPFP